MAAFHRLALSTHEGFGEVMAKMSASQFQALQDIKLHGDPHARVAGAAQHGAWSAVIHVIQNKHKWAMYDGTKWVLTASGEEAYQQEEERRRAAAKPRLVPTSAQENVRGRHKRSSGIRRTGRSS